MKIEAYFCRIVISHLLFLSIEPDTLANHRVASTTPDVERHLESAKVDQPIKIPSVPCRLPPDVSSCLSLFSTILNVDECILYII